MIIYLLTKAYSTEFVWVAIICGYVCLFVNQFISNMHGRILTNLITFAHYHVHMTLMTFSKPWGQKSALAAMANGVIR